MKVIGFYLTQLQQIAYAAFQALREVGKPSPPESCSGRA
jgi:hypothetical protein